MEESRYATLLLKDYPFTQASKATKSDLASPYCLLDEPCCDEEKKKAVWKVKANTTAQPSPKFTEIYEEYTSWHITLSGHVPSHRTHLAQILTKLASSFDLQLKSTGNRYKISGNAEKIMDLRQVFDKEILKADLNDTPAFEDRGATATIPHDHMTFDDTHFDHVTSGGGASDSNFPASLYDVVPSLIPDILAMLAKLPEGRIPGVYYRPSEGVVYIKKKAPEDTSLKFQDAYRTMVGQQRKLKVDTVPVPSGWVVTDVKQVVADFDGKYNQCVFLLGEELVKIISNSSRQFEQARKLLLEEFQTQLTVSLADGRMFMLKKGNIVTEDVDAIVNAANGHLSHDGGVALAINQASNGAVQRYSTQHMRQRQYREIQPGNVACTGAGGTLKCKSIIHAVGPRKGDHQCENTLNSLMRRILKEAEKQEVVSIAIPAISSGIFGVDKDLVARCIIDSIVNFKFSKSSALLRDIRVVIIDQPTYQCFAKYLKSKYKKLVVRTISESKGKNAIDSMSKAAEVTGNSKEAVPGTEISEVKGKDEEKSKDVTPDDWHTEKTEAKSAAHSSTSNYDRLIKLLQPLAHKWHKLAKSLNFLPGDVSKLASKGGDDAAKMERIIRTWWEQNKEVDRMRMLIKCLEKSNLGESDLRDKLQKALDNYKTLDTATDAGEDNTPYSTPDSEISTLSFTPTTSTVTTTSSFNRSVSDPTPSLKSPGDLSSDPSVTSTHGGGIPNYPIITDITPSSGVSSPQGGGTPSNPPPGFQNPPSSADMGGGMGGVSYARAAASGGGTFRGLSPSHFEHGISMGPPSSRPTEVPHHIKTSAATAHPGNNVESPKCSICLDDFKNPVKTSCGHSFCNECINRSLNTSPCCPICKALLQPLRGNQPPGTMNYTILETSLPGYPGHKTIKIEYYIPGGVQGPTHPNPGKPYSGTSRVAFLPCNAEGYEVLTLLQKAFSAGLIFTVGQSLTSGQDNVVVWNDIHHKTNSSGSLYGYPDPNYLKRVKEDLAAKGIVPDARDHSTV